MSQQGQITPLSCHEVGSPKPCRFAKRCDPKRQQFHSEFSVPLWGQNCGFFLIMTQDQAPGEASSPAPRAQLEVDEERRAIQEEGATP